MNVLAIAAQPKRLCYSHILTREFLHDRCVVQGQSSCALARELDIPRPTIDNYRKRYDIPVFKRGPNLRRYRPIRLSLFTDPQSDSDAYWIGFLAADGTVRGHGGHWDLSVHLKASDAPHLAKLCTALETDTPVRLVKGGGYRAAIVQFRGREVTEAAKPWGIVPNKTRSYRFPAHVPTPLIPAFLRGYFDGDGTLIVRRRAIYRRFIEVVCRFTSGSPLMVDDLTAVLTRYGVRVGRRYENTPRTHVLPIAAARSNIIAFVHLLYDGAEVSLDRKRALFEEAFAAWGER